jgi:hypothetical protein
MAKRNKSDNIRNTDGRKNNKRLPPKVQLNTSPTSKPARMNEAKKKQISNYAVNAMKKVFGSEQEAMETLAEFGKKGSLGHIKLLMEYGFGKPNDMSEDGGGKKTIAPVINFYNTPQIEEHTIDVDHTEEDDDIEDVDYE